MPNSGTDGRADRGSMLPVDDAEHPAAFYEEVARPEVAVHHGLRRPLAVQPPAHGGEGGQVRIDAGQASKPAAKHVRDSVQHLRHAD